MSFRVMFAHRHFLLGVAVRLLSRLMEVHATGVLTQQAAKVVRAIFGRPIRRTTQITENHCKSTRIPENASLVHRAVNRLNALRRLFLARERDVDACGGLHLHFARLTLRHLIETAKILAIHNYFCYFPILSKVLGPPQNLEWKLVKNRRWW